MDAVAFTPAELGQVDLGGGVPPAPAGGTPLPCLSSDNSDKHPRPLSTSEKKRAHALYANVAAFVGHWGIERCGFLTITAPDECTSEEFSKRFDNYKRRVLGELVLAYICVLEWQANGRPHFHLLVAVAEDIRTGFDFDHYLAVVAWNKARRQGPKPKGSLNRAPALKTLHERLFETAPAYRIGRQELVPIRTNQEAIARYVGGYLSKSLNNRQEEAKRVRIVRYSGNSAAWRNYKGAFSWVTIGGWLWRSKLKGWAVHHGCSDMRAVAALFGPRWAYNHRDAISAYPVTEWPTYGHWCASEGPSLPNGITPSDFPLVQTSPPVRRQCAAAHRQKLEVEEALADIEARCNHQQERTMETSLASEAAMITSDFAMRADLESVRSSLEGRGDFGEGVISSNYGVNSQDFLGSYSRDTLPTDDDPERSETARAGARLPAMQDGHFSGSPDSIAPAVLPALPLSAPLRDPVECKPEAEGRGCDVGDLVRRHAMSDYAPCPPALPLDGGTPQGETGARSGESAELPRKYVLRPRIHAPLQSRLHL